MPDRYASYRIDELVGSDTSGRVYRAYDESLDRTAALKVLSTGLSEHTGFVQQFKKNMRALAQLAHPRIPQIYCFGQEGNEHFVAFEWCEGGSLANQLRKHGRLSLQEALKILRECIQGLAAAWKLGIAHGNLKPNNVMVADNHEIKIAGFGLVPENPKELDVQDLSGAIGFMAPDLDQGGAIDFRADIYSLGVIFHYMLLNSLPSRQPLEANLQDDSSRGSLPLDVFKIIDRMTREDPQERYGSYQELIRDIERLAASSPEAPVPAIPRFVEAKAGVHLKRESLFDLLSEMYREMVTGVLRVSWMSLQKQFLVRRGEILFFESTQQNESLESLMIAEKWLNGSESLHHRTPEELIRRVLINRACTLDQFREAYLRLVKEALLQVFHWPFFEGEFLPGKIENEPFASLRLSDILLETSRTLIDIGWIRSQLPKDSLISKTVSFEWLLSPFALTREESFLAYRFEGEDVNPDTLGLLTGLPEDTILRVTFLLQRIGALELRPAAAVRAQRPAVRTGPPPPAKQEAKTTRIPVAEPPRKEPEKQPQPVAVPTSLKERKLSFEEALIRAETQKPAKEADVGRTLKQGEACFEKAEKEYENKNYGKAALLCKEALQHYQDARYYYLLGSSYSHHPRFQKDAEEALHAAISLAPSNPDYHAILAAFYSQRNLWLRARTHCLKALDLSAGHKTAGSLYKKILELNLGKGDCWCIWQGGKPA